MGDAAGVGPEIILKALKKTALYEMAVPVVYGDSNRLKEAAEITKTDYSFIAVEDMGNIAPDPQTLYYVEIPGLSSGLPFGELSEEAGKFAYLYLEKAIADAQEGKINAICTAPLNKEAMQNAGYKFPGHTEILAKLTNTDDYSMMLSAPELKVIHLTTHLGLIDAINAITPERTYNVIKLAHETLLKSGMEDPRIAVCGINPHAGESGLFGYGEEEDKLIPGIEKAQQEQINVEGPYAADTLFFRAKRGDFDIVVACYHDQGHVPIKVMGLEAGVNITVGLKGGIIRTSVDHGTAFDIAGKNIADEGSMEEALKAAAELAPVK